MCENKMTQKYIFPPETKQTTNIFQKQVFYFLDEEKTDLETQTERAKPKSQPKES